VDIAALCDRVLPDIQIKSRTAPVVHNMISVACFTHLWNYNKAPLYLKVKMDLSIFFLNQSLGHTPFESTPLRVNQGEESSERSSSMFTQTF